MKVAVKKEWLELLTNSVSEDSSNATGHVLCEYNKEKFQVTMVATNNKQLIKCTFYNKVAQKEEVESFKTLLDIDILKFQMKNKKYKTNTGHVIVNTKQSESEDVKASQYVNYERLLETACKYPANSSNILKLNFQNNSKKDYFITMYDAPFKIGSDILNNLLVLKQDFTLIQDKDREEAIFEKPLHLYLTEDDNNNTLHFMAMPERP